MGIVAVIALACAVVSLLGVVLLFWMGLRWKKRIVVEVDRTSTKVFSLQEKATRQETLCSQREASSVRNHRALRERADELLKRFDSFGTTNDETDTGLDDASRDAKMRRIHSRSFSGGT